MDCVDARPPTPHRDAGSDGPTDASFRDALEESEAAVIPISTLVSFDISRTTDSGFQNVATYDKPVRVSALSTSGSVVFTPDGGATSEGMLDGVATGPNWFAVEDISASPQIWPTLQPALVDRTVPAVALVGVTKSTLTPLMVDHDQPWAPLTGHATLIAIFARGGAPVGGVSMTANLPSGATVAYEQAGAYVTTMTTASPATDDEGTLIIRDLPGMATYPGTTNTRFTYQLGSATLSFDAHLAADFVTWMIVSVP